MIGPASLSRRVILTAISAGSLVRGYAYAIHQGAGGPSLSGGAVQNLESVLPVQAIGALWIIIGIWGLTAAVVGRWLWATVATGGMWAVWGLGYFFSSIGWIPGKETDWISAGTYLSVAVVIFATSGLIDRKAVDES